MLLRTRRKSSVSLPWRPQVLENPDKKKFSKTYPPSLRRTYRVPVLLFEGRLLETILKAERRTAAAGDAASVTVRTRGPATGLGRCGARGRGLVTSHSGGPGTRPGGTTTPPSRSFAGLGLRVRSSNAWPRREPARRQPPQRMSVDQEARTLDQKSPPVERREAPLRDRKRRGHASQGVSGGRAGRSRGLASPCVFRRSAPLGGARMQTTASPGPQRNRGGGALAV